MSVPTLVLVKLDCVAELSACEADVLVALELPFALLLDPEPCVLDAAVAEDCADAPEEAVDPLDPEDVSPPVDDCVVVGVDAAVLVGVVEDEVGVSEEVGDVVDVGGSAVDDAGCDAADESEGVPVGDEEGGSVKLVKETGSEVGEGDEGDEERAEGSVVLEETPGSGAEELGAEAGDEAGVGDVLEAGDPDGVDKGVEPAVEETADAMVVVVGRQHAKKARARKGNSNYAKGE